MTHVALVRFGLLVPRATLHVVLQVVGTCVGSTALGAFVGVFFVARALVWKVSKTLFTLIAFAVKSS